MSVIEMLLARQMHSSQLGCRRKVAQQYKKVDSVDFNGSERLELVVTPKALRCLPKSRTRPLMIQKRLSIY